MTTINVVERNQIVSVYSSAEFDQELLLRPISNVVLRNKNKDELILLERVMLYAKETIPTVEEVKSAWRAMFFNTWSIKFEIERLAHKDLRCGNIFRNLDKFDVLMFNGGELVFDTSVFNLVLVEGRVGMTPKSKTREDFPTTKSLKVHAYKMGDSSFEMLHIESYMLKHLRDAEKEEEATEETAPTAKKKKGATRKTTSKTPRTKREKPEAKKEEQPAEVLQPEAEKKAA